MRGRRDGAFDPEPGSGGKRRSWLRYCAHADRGGADPRPRGGAPHRFRNCRHGDGDAAGGGNIINIGSIITSSPAPNSAVYSATKGAVDVLTRALANDLGARKIRVNSINPGGTDTEGARALGIVGSEFQKQLIAGTPLGRFGRPEDIAPIAVFLASPEAGWLTGQVVLAGGGAH